MEIFVENSDWNNQFNSVEEFMEEEGITEGGEFSLIRISVCASVRYRVIDGKGTPVGISFAEHKC